MSAHSVVPVLPVRLRRVFCLCTLVLTQASFASAALTTSAVAGDTPASASTPPPPSVAASPAVPVAPSTAPAAPPAAVTPSAAPVTPSEPPAAPAPASPPAPHPLLVAMDDVLSREPQHAGALYVAARTAANLGNGEAALGYLQRLLGSGLGDQLDPDDFPALQNNPAYRALATRFAAQAPRHGKASVQDTHCAGLLPEGTAFDARRGQLLLSSGRQRTVFALGANGQCWALLPAGSGGLLAVLGMSVDPATDSLWVASSAAPFMQDARPEEAGTARLARIDLASGTVAASWSVAGGALLNDLTLASDGSVYVTDSSGGKIMRLAPGAQQLLALPLSQTLEGPNGIVALPDGDLLVADFHGLWRIHQPAGQAPQALRLQGPGKLYLGGFDGLARHGKHIIGIQNLAGLGRIWQLTVRGNQLQTRLLLRGDPALLNPTTGAVAGDQFRFVADTKLQKSAPDGGLSALPAGRSGHRVLSVRLPR